MTLPTGGARLREIESRLAETDPGLAAMLTGLDADPGRARYRVRRERVRYTLVMAFLTALLALCAAMIVLTLG